jgi:ubiquinone/menaquinone biosynthesis C-methylase UbiE
MESDSKSNKTVIAEVFDRAAASYGQLGASYFSIFGQRLVEYTRLNPGMRVLDVACGRGAVLFPAAEAVGEQGFVTGIDISEGMAIATRAELESRSIANADVRVMDAERLEFADETFDAALCGFALFFMPDPAAALGEFQRVTRPGSRLGISTWGPDDEQFGWYVDLLNHYLPNANMPRLHTAADFDHQEKLAAMMAGSGYRVLEIYKETTTFAYASPDEWWNARWSHFGRLRLEQMSPETLSAFRAEMDERLAAMQNGVGAVESEMEVLYTIAEKLR